MKHNKNVIRLSESELPKLIDKYVRQVLSEGFQFDSTRDEERDYLNSILKNTTHLFRDEEDRNETYRAYVNNERRRGGQPTLDGFLSYIGVSRRDLKQENKKRTTVRLTESDLHNMISEAVKNALMEMDKQGYDLAIQNHPHLMNKVDPRTFANRARGVNAQGRQRNDDKSTMEMAAINSWNKNYGSHEDISSNEDGVDTHHRYDAEMTDGYQTRQRGIGSKFVNGKLQSEYEMNAPTNKWANVQNIGKMSNSPYYNKAVDGANVAHQMLNRNGKYIKGKGWQ